MHEGHGDQDHEHEHWEGPGLFARREPMRPRDLRRRAFTVGIGGPVGSGKTALVLALCRALRDRHRLGVVTNDIFTREDAEFLQRHQALPTEQIRAVETGGCPHAAIREDITPNLTALEDLMATVAPELLIVESGGDNRASRACAAPLAHKGRSPPSAASLAAGRRRNREAPSGEESKRMAKKRKMAIRALPPANAPPMMVKAKPTTETIVIHTTRERSATPMVPRSTDRLDRGRAGTRPRSTPCTR
jgi:hypothetical protein